MKSLLGYRIQQDFWAELEIQAEVFAYKQDRDKDGESCANSTLPMIYGRRLWIGKGLGVGQQQKPSGLNEKKRIDS